MTFGWNASIKNSLFIIPMT